ncbi:AraC family transcriptional regulator [Companilactobacillus sp. HBUAS56257]|uniref:AraC family transcriptional regulator n=1 Tax=Companilactobacillus sp. HBUAS56257 TaxID=3109360 RepID=UPI002FF0EF61
MNYLISLNKPIIFLWAGHFLKNDNAPWTRRKTHHDADSQIMMLEKGIMHLEINGEKVELHAGDILYAPQHAEIKGISATTGEISSYWVHFLVDSQKINDNDRLIHDAIVQQRNKNEIPKLNNYALIPQIYKMHNPDELFTLFNQLLQSINESPSSQRQNDFFTSFLLCKISTDYLKTLSLKYSKNPLTSTKVAEWIRINISNNLTVQQVADTFELNPSYLSRLFKRETGTSIKSYIINMKIEFAKYLLVSTSLQISEIAEKSYFSDDKQFLHTFKKKTGTTPSKFRKNISNTYLNSDVVDPKPKLPTQYGTKALHAMIVDIINAQNNHSKS